MGGCAFAYGGLVVNLRMVMVMRNEMTFRYPILFFVPFLVLVGISLDTHMRR